MLRMQSTREIIRAVATARNVKPGTLKKWFQRGYIPAAARYGFLTDMRSFGVPVEWDDLGELKTFLKVHPVPACSSQNAMEMRIPTNLHVRQDETEPFAAAPQVVEAVQMFVYVTNVQQ